MFFISECIYVRYIIKMEFKVCIKVQGRAMESAKNLPTPKTLPSASTPTTQHYK